MSDKKILIGKIVNVVGLKGEVKVYNYSENLDRFETLEEIFLSDKGETYDLFSIENVRYKGNLPILKLSNINDRNKSEDLVGKEVYMRESDLEELPDGVYYVKDMIGMAVFKDDGELLGKLKDITSHTPQKLYVIERIGKKDILIPGVDEFILNIDMDKKRIDVRVIEGLYED